MTIRFIGPLLCGGLLALALTTGASAFWYIPGTDTNMKIGGYLKNNPNNNGKGNKAIQQPLVGVNKKASKSNTSDRMGGGGGSG